MNGPLFGAALFAAAVFGLDIGPVEAPSTVRPMRCVVRILPAIRLSVAIEPAVSLQSAAAPALSLIPGIDA